MKTKFDNIKEYLINLGFKLYDEESSVIHFYMDMTTPNHNHVDIQYGTEDDKILMRLIGYKHVEDEYYIEDWSENYIDDLKKIQKKINYWDKY